MELMNAPMHSPMHAPMRPPVQQVNVKRIKSMATPKNNNNNVNITTEFVTVTREMAFTWLDTTDIQNRGVQQQTVHKYARRMNTGKWAVTGETLKFDPDGNLIDGQHRLWGFIETNFTEMDFLVMRGVPTHRYRRRPYSCPHIVYAWHPRRTIARCCY